MQYNIIASEIEVAFSLLFENDFDIYSIETALRIKPDECKRRDETRINPISKEHNCGYWTLSTGQVRNWDVNVVMESLISRLNDKEGKIREIMSEHGAKAKFDIYVGLGNDDNVGFCLSKEMQTYIAELEATIDVYIYNNV